MAKNMVCLGWLLFLGPEYDLVAMRQSIQETTGVQVALRFRNIQDQLNAQAKQHEQRIKAIHIEVDWTESAEKRKRLQEAFSVDASEFPTGIKMRLVPELSAITNPNGWAKAAQLQALQAQFLTISETYVLHVTPHPEYNKRRTLTTLQQFVPTSPHATPFNQPFHAVSPLAKIDGYIIRYLPEHRSKVLAIITRLEELLPGLQAGRDIKGPVAIKTTNILQTSRSQGLNLTGKRDPPSPQGKPSSGQLDKSKAAYLTPTSGIWSLSREPKRVLLNQVRMLPIPGMPEKYATSISSTTQHPYSQLAPTIIHSQLNPNRWLTAILMLLQNTAWDRWKYRNNLTPTGWGEILASRLDTKSIIQS